MTSSTPNREVTYRDDGQVPREQILELYAQENWSSARKPEQLYDGLMNSARLVAAWSGSRLVGLGNAITDGHLVVYYPHLIVAADWRRRGIGREILVRLQAPYEGFHQHVLVADADAVPFYENCGFQRAGRTEPMWIYDGDDH